MAAARERCEELALRHYENFPVGRWGVPPERRPDIHAIYAFARIADDYADEPAHEGKRLELLDAWGRQLEACATGAAVDDPVFLALGDTIRRLSLPLEPLRDLLSAFRQDAVKQRYETWDEVLDYCRRSANPIGRLVLLVCGQDNDQTRPLSDDLCTALQLTNFWQDLSVDHPRGRSYLPRADAVAAGVDLEKLVSGAELEDEEFDRVTELLADVEERTEELYESSRPLIGMLRGRLRMEIAATWLGGSAILEETKDMEGEALTARPALGRFDKIRIAVQALLGRV